MKTPTRRQREALYAGVADMPLPDVEQAMDRFEHGYARKPHTATTYLLYDLHRLRTRTTRRPLPGILATA